MAQRAGEFLIATATASPGVSQDRLLVLPAGRRVLLAVADGAGGAGGGARAAELALSFLALWEGDERKDWAAGLEEIDHKLFQDTAAGETTVALVLAGPDGVEGASIGDSGAWLIGARGSQDLTEHQQRVPRLGSGRALAVPFELDSLDGTLLCATDGLFRYASPARICEAAAHPDLDEAAEQLLALVRLSSGRLQDDVALILCRPINNHSQ